MELMTTMAREILEAQPMSRLLGARLTHLDDRSATIEVDIEDRHRQQFGLVHGGMLAYLVDNALSFAAGASLGPSLVSTGFTISMVGNTREGTLRAVGEVVHATVDHAVCSVEVLAVRPDGSTKVCAVAQGTAVSTARDVVRAL